MTRTVVIPRAVVAIALSCGVSAVRMTVQEQRSWYLEHVGYDPVAEDPAEAQHLTDLVAGVMLLQSTSHLVSAGSASELEVETAERLLTLYLRGNEYALVMLSRAHEVGVPVEDRVPSSFSELAL